MVNVLQCHRLRMDTCLLCVSECVHACVHVYVYVHACVHVYARMCVCACVCVNSIQSYLILYQDTVYSVLIRKVYICNLKVCITMEFQCF